MDGFLLRFAIHKEVPDVYKDDLELCKRRCGALQEMEGTENAVEVET